MADDVSFVIDGALDQPTGGYIYDRFAIEGLRARGTHVEVVGLETRWLGSILANVRVAGLLRRRRGEGHLVILDELCHPRATLAAVAESRRRDRCATLVLVHHLAASERAGISRAVRLSIERALLAAAGSVVATSHTTRRVLEELGVPRRKLAVVRPGRDRLGERSSPIEGPTAAPRLLFLGSITPRKNALGLVRVFCSLEGEATLTLVGPLDRDRGYAARVVEAAARCARIRVAGPLEDGALARELGGHDVLVLPSLYEGFGIAIAEALAHGLAVVATRAGAIPELVRHGREAELVPAGDLRALRAALAGLVRDPGRVAGMRAMAIERARGLPTWAQMQNEFADATARLR